MNNKKINLTELKVKSFVTKLDKSSEDTVVGGLASIGKFCTWNPNCAADGNLSDGAFCTTRFRA